MNAKGRKKIRILRIIGECKTGGTETIALNYYHGLNHDKVAMDFLFYGDSLQRFNQELETYGDRVINIVEYSKDLIKSIKEIRDVVRIGNYDIVHSQLNTLNVFPLVGAWLGGAKIRICANHSTANLKYEFIKSIIKYVLRPTTKIFATHYAACSEFAGAWCFGKRILDQGKIKIIHNAIDLNNFTFSKEVRKNIRSKEAWKGKFVIGHVGRFTEQKNHRFIIDVFLKVHNKCPEALLVLAGEGELMEEIRQKVHALGLGDAVQFLGVRFDISQLMQGMDLFLFPSLYEGLGNVIVESQAVGLRSVVSDAVPSEVKMTSLVDTISLNEKVEKWAETVLQYRNKYERVDTHTALIKHGYEIKSATIELENYYQNLVINRE